LVHRRERFHRGCALLTEERRRIEQRARPTRRILPGGRKLELDEARRGRRRRRRELPGLEPGGRGDELGARAHDRGYGPREALGQQSPRRHFFGGVATRNRKSEPLDERRRTRLDLGPRRSAL